MSDSLQFCISDLRHSAIVDDAHDLLSCVLAVCNRLDALATHAGAAAEPTVEQVERELGMGHGAWDMEDPAKIIGTVLRLAALTSAPAEPAPSMERFEHVIQWVRDNYQDHSIASLCDGLRAAYYALCRPAETPPAADWREPHPPSRHCMCPSCIPSFDDRFAPQAAGAIDARGQEALAQISSLLTSMFVSARAHVQGVDETVVGYTVRTGSLHKIVGILASYKPVIIPSNLPTAHETITGILTGTSASRQEAPPAAGAAQAVARVVGRTIPAGHDTPAYETFDVEWLSIDPFTWRGNLYAALAATPAPEAAETVETLRYVDKMLTNLQPHIAQSCYPGRAGFIDNYVDPVLEKVRAALKAAQPVERGEK